MKKTLFLTSMILVSGSIQAWGWSSFTSAVSSAANTVSHGVTDAASATANAAEAAAEATRNAAEAAANATAGAVTSAADATAGVATKAADDVAKEANTAAVTLHITHPNSPDPKAAVRAALQADIVKVKNGMVQFTNLFNKYGKGSLNELKAFLLGGAKTTPVGYSGRQPYISYGLDGTTPEYYYKAIDKVLPKLGKIYKVLAGNDYWNILKCPNDPQCAKILSHIPAVSDKIGNAIVKAFEAKMEEYK